MRKVIFFAVLCNLVLPALAYSEECFMAKPTVQITEDTCGPIDAAVTIKDCTSGKEINSFTATMGLDCLDSPHKLKLLYNNTSMLVGEFTRFDEDPVLILSKAYVETGGRRPAALNRPKLQKGETCFKMRPVEPINSETCEPVRAQIQFQDCRTHKNIGDRLEVTTHFSCGENREELKYWYKKVMLVGRLKKTGKGYKVSQTYTLVYPSIYGVYNDRHTSSVASP